MTSPALAVSGDLRIFPSGSTHQSQQLTTREGCADFVDPTFQQILSVIFRVYFEVKIPTRKCMNNIFVYSPPPPPIPPTDP